MSLTTASNTSLILSMSPVFVALLGVLFRIERIHWAAWLGIVISFVGLYLVISRAGRRLRFFAPKEFRGDVAIFFGTMIWALTRSVLQAFLEKLSPLQFSTVTMGFGALFYVPLTVKDIVRIPWASVSWAGLGGAWSCPRLFGLVVGYLIWYYSVQKVGNAKTAIYSNLTPIFTVLLPRSFSERNFTGSRSSARRSSWPAFT